MALKEQFLRDYIKAIREGNAAVFAGAGLSRPSGFVTWKDFLRPMAEDIGLNIDYESDLTAVAQFVKNRSGNRATINTSILDAYSKDVRINENVRILTRLPIFTYWTTNYDHLIEDGLRDANRNPDVKIESKQLSMAKRDRDAVVYKMHGDVDHAADAVLTKDDYVQYDKKHPFFRSVLQGDLISKTFVFVGFSFEDPNFDCILGQIRLLLTDNIRQHYCFMKQIAKNDCVNDEEYGYKKAHQKLREEDLARYGIQTIFVDDYSEVTEILRDLESAVLANNVFISGSIDVYSDEWTKDRTDEFSYKLGNALVKEGFRITTGFGLGVGSSIINGALDEIYSSRYKHMDEHLCLRPFPQGISSDKEQLLKWKKYREEIINNNGIVIFIFGNKKDDEGKKILADGCMQEYSMAVEKRRMIIPVGSTGDAATKIHTIIKSENESNNKYTYLQEYIDALGTESDIDKIVDIILRIVKEKRTV